MMKVVHYTLGEYPFRTGGMTIYVDSLIENQSLLYGKNNIMRLSVASNFVPFSYIRYRGKNHFELVNIGFIPLLLGVKHPDQFLSESSNSSRLYEIIDDFKPDILHIHTLMALPESLIDYCKSKSIHIVMTTHDFYGICPRVNLINSKGDLCNNIIAGCGECNKNASSLLMIKIKNMRLFHKCKASFRKIDKVIKKKTTNNAVDSNPVTNVISYKQLFDYNNSIIRKIDLFIYNSSQTKDIYSKYYGERHSTTLFVTTASIKYNQKVTKVFGNETKKLRLLYIGPENTYKGLPGLLSVLERINPALCELHIYGCNAMNQKNVFYHGYYEQNDISTIFNDIDLLIVPSLCYETLSLVTLEAISFNIPVLLSDHVGAKDIVANINEWFVFKSLDDLFLKITHIISHRDVLRLFVSKAQSMNLNFTMDKHVKCLHTIYEKELNNKSYKNENSNTGN